MTSVTLHLLDIEGTTTPLDFVQQTLFPLARERVGAFVEHHRDRPDVQAVLAELHDAWRAEDVAQREPSTWPAHGGATTYARWLMGRDRKLTPLKALQGLVWEEAYRTGVLVAPLYDDVAPVMRVWAQAGRRASIFSSGSTLAQRLLFAHTSAGDLTKLLGSLFDTTVGSKLDAASYVSIAVALDAEPASVRFVSDVVAELDAAREAGMDTALCVRGPAAPPGAERHRVVRSLRELERPAHEVAVDLPRSGRSRHQHARVIPVVSTPPSGARAADEPGYAIVGISTSEMRTPEHVVQIPHSDPKQPRELALGLSYPEAMRRAGAVPVIIPPLDTDSIEPLLDGLCGLCLSGGPDIHPSAYGAEPHPALGLTEPHLDLFEIALVRAAEARDLPVLAICRGLQVLNVSRGGTLVQDLPSQRPSDLVHRQKEPGYVPTHDATFEPDSLVAQALGVQAARVNSFHHQAVDILGAGLRIVGRAPDGVAEAIEATDRAFTLAVQWHAESLIDSPEQTRLLRRFVETARIYASGAARAA